MAEHDENQVTLDPPTEGELYGCFRAASYKMIRAE
jgi:hypothetical protein